MACIPYGGDPPPPPRPGVLETTERVPIQYYSPLYQYGPHQYKGETFTKWIDGETDEELDEPCPVAPFQPHWQEIGWLVTNLQREAPAHESEDGKFEVFTIEQTGTQIEMEGGPPIDYSGVRHDDEITARYEAMFGDNFICIHDMYKPRPLRRRGFYASEIFLSIYEVGYGIETLEFCYMVDITEQETVSTTMSIYPEHGKDNPGTAGGTDSKMSKPRRWEWDSNEYHALLGTPYGSVMASMLLSLARPGEKRIARIWTWYCPMVGRPYLRDKLKWWPGMRFDIEETFGYVSRSSSSGTSAGNGSGASSSGSSQPPRPRISTPTVSLISEMFPSQNSSEPRSTPSEIQRAMEDTLYQLEEIRDSALGRGLSGDEQEQVNSLTSEALAELDGVQTPGAPGSDGSKRGNGSPKSRASIESDLFGRSMSASPFSFRYENGSSRDGNGSSGNGNGSSRDGNGSSGNGTSESGRSSSTSSGSLAVEIRATAPRAQRQAVRVIRGIVRSRRRVETAARTRELVIATAEERARTSLAEVAEDLRGAIEGGITVEAGIALLLRAVSSLIALNLPGEGGEEEGGEEYGQEEEHEQEEGHEQEGERGDEDEPMPDTAPVPGDGATSEKGAVPEEAGRGQGRGREPGHGHGRGSGAAPAGAVEDDTGAFNTEGVVEEGPEQPRGRLRGVSKKRRQVPEGYEKPETHSKKKRGGGAGGVGVGA